MRRLLASVLGIAALTLFVWYYVQGDQSGSLGEDPGAVSRELTSVPVGRGISNEPSPNPTAAERLQPDLAFWCAWGLQTDRCLDAVDAWIRSREATMTGWPGHSGRTWGEVFDDFVAQVGRVERAVGDSECGGDGWRPDLGDQCAAWETHNVALAIRACLQPPDNALGRVRLLDQHGETDLAAIRRAKQQEAEEWVQRAWLARECDRMWAPLKDRLAGLVGYADDSPWVDAAYGERAALLGDKAAFKYYVHNKMALDVWRVYGNTIIVDFADDQAVARARRADLATRAVVDEIVKRDPATGYDLLGDFEIERVPQVRSRSRYSKYFPEDYWIARVERATAYKLAALRLQGIPPHLSFQELVDRDIDWITIGKLIGEDVYSLSYRVDQLLADPIEGSSGGSSGHTRLAPHK